MISEKDKQIILEKLDLAYPDAKCELNYNSPFELLVAVILSAQCTDKRVNEVTKTLFKKYNTANDFANLNQEVLEREIYSCGFYKNKAKNIIDASRDIIDRFSGNIADNLEDLMSLSGVGRKTANVILGEYFKQNVIAVDTHVFRVSKRLNFSLSGTVEGVERDLVNLFKENLFILHQLLIFHGRYCCKSQKPLCNMCPVSDYCKVKKEKI